MADEADRTQDDFDREDEAQVKLRERTPKYEIPKGYPGDCDICEEWSGRLLVGVCAQCRERFKL